MNMKERAAHDTKAGQPESPPHPFCPPPPPPPGVHFLTAENKRIEGLQVPVHFLFADGPIAPQHASGPYLPCHPWAHVTVSVCPANAHVNANRRKGCNGT